MQVLVQHKPISVADNPYEAWNKMYSASYIQVDLNKVREAIYQALAAVGGAGHNPTKLYIGNKELASISGEINFMLNTKVMTWDMPIGQYCGLEVNVVSWMSGILVV